MLPYGNLSLSPSMSQIIPLVSTIMKKIKKRVCLILFIEVLFICNVYAQTLLLPYNSTWKYLDNGTDQGAAWQSVTFDDTGWKTGYGKFGYGIPDTTTVVSYGPDAGNKYITTYFRKAISIADTSAFRFYTGNIMRDDGAVVYVNGVEVYRNNMPTDSITYTTLAAHPTGGDDGVTPISFTVPATAFAIGTNVIAVEIHQYNTSSSDIAFDMELIVQDTFPSSGEVVSPIFVSEPVRYDSDDPAIWINKANPAESLIIGTDKNTDGALYVYNMEGRIVADKVVRGLRYPNNVDVEYGLMLQGKSMDIAVTTERYAGKLRIYSLPDMLPVDNGGIDVFVGETERSYHWPMGISLYKAPSDGRIYAIVSRKSGPTDGTYLWQYLLEDNGRGSVKGTLVRKFGQFSGTQEIESIAVDDELGYVYYSDEKVGVRKYHADPAQGNQELALFATDFDGEQEGIAIYMRGDSTGYILVSNQFSGEFRIFTREGTPINPHDHKWVKTIKTAAKDTDGIEVTNFPILPHFPNGVFVAMSNNKTFHYYRWEDIAGYDLRVEPPRLTSTNTQALQANISSTAEDYPLQVYPNLAKRGALITIKASQKGAAIVLVRDMTGRTVYATEFNGTISLETTKLPAGMYIISHFGNGRLTIQKFVVTN